MSFPQSDTILLSIHPNHVQNILSGAKRFELRRRVPLKIKRIVIYETAPSSKIVAIADVQNVLSGDPEKIWVEVRDAVCIDATFYQDYFRGRESAFAIQIGNVQSTTGIPLNHPMLNLIPPQSFCYLDEKKMKWLLENLSSGKRDDANGCHQHGVSCSSLRS